MKITSVNSLSTCNKCKKFWLFRLAPLTLVQLMLLGCGGGGNSGSAAGDDSSMIGVSSSINVASSSSVSSSSTTTSIASSSSYSASFSSSQSSTGFSFAAVDASNQFTSTINENFYVFKQVSEPNVLRYFPRQLALSGLPGIASVTRTNKVSSLLKVFLDLSNSDWTSANQVSLSSKYSLDVDLQKLKQESEAAGYTELADLKVKPPVMVFEQRYTTSVPQARIQIQCENLTLLIGSNSVTLHDCNLADADGIIATQAINNIGSFKYEQLNFDPDAISGNKSLRGTFTVDYTLPGTREFDRLLSTNSGDLQHTWQLHLSWPLTETTVSSATLTVNWKILLTDLNTLVSSGQTQWGESAINTFVSSEINSGSIVLPIVAELTPALQLAIVNYMKQELFVAIYSESAAAPLMWAPKLRFKNVDQLNTQQVAFRYFDAELSIMSKIDLGCLSTPDTQNNIYKSSNCADN